MNAATKLIRSIALLLAKGFWAVVTFVRFRSFLARWWLRDLVYDFRAIRAAQKYDRAQL